MPEPRERHDADRADFSFLKVKAGIHYYTRKVIMRNTIGSGAMLLVLLCSAAQAQIRGTITSPPTSSG